MPFKKTNPDSKDARSLAEARKVFIGRTSELLFFIQHVLEPEDPIYHIISISGQGGVGKSTLLNYFIDETHGVNFKDYCMVAQVNERQTTPADIMEKFAKQLSLKRDFKKALSQYKETLRRVLSEPEAKQEALLRQATTGAAGSLAKTIPVMGGVLETVAEPTVGFIWDQLHFRQRLKDAERLEDPTRDLTRNFVKELNQVADASVTVGLDRIRRQRRVVLFFDTFEQLAAEAAPWLLDYFLAAEVSSNVVLVVAGREPIDRSTPDDPKRWLRYHEEKVIHLISLEHFTQDETRTYLAERGITDPAQVDTYWQLSRGIPLFLGLLTSNAQGNIDPTKDVVENFLRGIPKEEQVKQRLALDAACFSKPFSQDDLAAFGYIPEQDRSQLYLWLTGQTFVRSNPLDGLYLYHEEVRDMFCRHLYQRSHSDYHATRRALAEHYQQQLERLQTEEGKEVYDSAEWLELVIALLNQYLLLPDEASRNRAIVEGLRMYTRVQGRGEIVKVVREEVLRLLKLLSQQPFNSQLSLSIRVVIAQLLQSGEPELGGQEFLLAANFLIEKVSHDPVFPTELLALLYRGRGEAYNALKEYDRAIENYDRAIELDPNAATLYDYRGDAYYALEKYERAFEDYNRAIELDSGRARFYMDRGHAYYALEKYERAIEDYTRAIELDSGRARFYMDRGYAYYRLKEYEQAIEDYTRAIELDSGIAWFYNYRGDAYYALEKYERAIEDYSRAIELDSGIAWYYMDRGKAYYALEKYERAIEDYTRAIEMDSGIAWYYNYRGKAYSGLKEYERAIEDYTRAIELDPKQAWVYSNRGYAYSELKEYERAIEDYTRANELDEKYIWPYTNRGGVYLSLKEHERAIEDFNRAIELDSGIAWVYGLRGVAYSELKEHQKALEDYTRAIELDSGIAWVYRKRGDAYHALKEYDRAIENYDRAIELDPNAATLYDSRGDAYYALEKYERAIEDYNRAIELDSGIAWFYNYRGDAYYALEMYERAIEDYNRAIELDSGRARFYMDRGHAYYALEKYERAIEDYNRAIKLDSGIAWYYRDRGDAYSELKEYQKATEDYNQAIELVPTDDWAYFQRGRAYLWLKDLQQAKADFAHCLELDASRVQAQLMSAWVEMCQERPDVEMAQQLEEIVTAASNRQRYGAGVCRGISLWIRGSFEQALIELEQVISLDPAIKDAYFWKGMICASLRRDEEAMAAIARALELKLPSVLLTSLRWLDEDRQDFCEKYVEPLLTSYNVLNHQEPSE